MMTYIQVLVGQGLCRLCCAVQFKVFDICMHDNNVIEPI